MWYGTPHTQAFERKKRTQGAHQPTLRATIQKFNLINQYHTLFFFYIQSATPPATSRHRRVWEKGLRGLTYSPRQDRNKRASSGAVRLQSPISSSVCGRRTRCKHLLSWDLSREIKHFSPGLLKIVRLVLFFKKKVRGHKLPRNIEDKVCDECGGCEYHLRDIHLVIKNLENVRSSEGTLSFLIR